MVRFPADRIDRGRFDAISTGYVAMTRAKVRPLPGKDEDFFFRSMAPSSALLRYVEQTGAASTASLS